MSVALTDTDPAEQFSQIKSTEQETLDTLTLCSYTDNISVQWGFPPFKNRLIPLPEDPKDPISSQRYHRCTWVLKSKTIIFTQVSAHIVLIFYDLTDTPFGTGV